MVAVTDCWFCTTDEIEPGDLNSRLVEDHWPEDGHPDYLELKRELETEFDESFSLTALKTHLDDHIRYGWGAEQ